MKLVAIALVLALSASTAGAQVGAADPPAAASTCDAAAVEADRAALDRERHAARTWNTAWIITYAALAGVQVGAAAIEFSPGRPYDDAAEASLYIGAGKAVIGSLSRLVLPLRVPAVARSGDACVDQAALARAHARIARKERNTFWLQLGGGLAMHAVSGGYLVIHEDSWRAAITSFALGAVMSAITLYTEPKTSWRHRRSVAVTPMPTTDGGVGLAVVGQF